MNALSRLGSHKSYLPLLFYIFIIVLFDLHYYIASGGPILSSDSFTYLRLAEEIQKGHFFIEQWGTGSLSTQLLYPYLIALFQRIAFDPLIAGMLVSLISTIGTIIIVYILTKNLFGLFASNLAVILMIVNPFYLIHSAAVLTESLFTFLLVSSIFLVYKISQNQLRSLHLLCFATGAVGGMAWHTRDVGIIIIPLSFAWLTYFLREKKLSSPMIIKYIFVFAMGFLLFFVPFVILSKSSPNLNSYNNTAKRNVLKILTAPNFSDPTTREIGIRALTDDELNYSIVANSQKKISLNDFMDQLDWVIKKFILSVGKIFLYIIAITAGLGLFAIIGLIADLRGCNKTMALIFLSYILFYLLFYSATGSFMGAVRPERYLFPVFPLLIILASNGIKLSIEFIIKRFKIEKLRTTLFRIIIFSGGMMLLFPPLIKQGYGYTQNVLAYKNIATTIKTLKNKEAVIMTRNPFLPFSANTSFILTPYADYENTIRFAKMKGVDFFFIEKDLYAPQLEFLKNGGTSTPELKFISSTDQGSLYKIIY